MTPKEKAEEIFDKMLLDWGCNECHNHWAKDCALIAVDEILNNNKILFEDVLNNQYWKEVKQEIEKL
jgi:hypothetical protein